MKKLLFITLFVMLYSVAYSQIDELPEKVDNSFKTKYPGAKNVYWDQDNDNYRIEFEISSDTYNAIYTGSGGWIETAKIISDTEIPANVISAVSKSYPECSISYAEYIETGKGEKFYRVNSFTDEADYKINIDSNGKILSTDINKYDYELDEEE